MSFTQSNPTPASLPSTSVPSPDALQSWRDRRAGCGNDCAARQRILPDAARSGAAGACFARSSCPPGVPVAPPSFPDAPAPSVVTTAAPHTPARPPFGPPDLPPTTIPSVVPTPNVSAPAAPTGAPPGSRPLGLPDVPQPGASVGAAQIDQPSEIDYSAIPRLFGDALALTRPAHAATPYLGLDSRAVPGGSAPIQADNLYFLAERAPVGGTSLSEPPTSVPSAPAPVATNPAPQLLPGEPEELRDFQPLGGRSAPLFGRRVAVNASAPTPVPSGFENNASLGNAASGAGPGASDALYFVSHTGGHKNVIELHARAGGGRASRAMSRSSPRIRNRAATFRSLSGEARLPDPATAGAWQAAHLARQRRDDAKAAGGHRSACAFLRIRELQHSSRGARARRALDRRLRSGARQGATLSESAFGEGHHLRARRDRRHQSRRPDLGSAQCETGRRNRHLLARAPRQHCALADALRREPARGCALRRLTIAARSFWKNMRSCSIRAHASCR